MTIYITSHQQNVLDDYIQDGFEHAMEHDSTCRVTCMSCDKDVAACNFEATSAQDFGWVNLTTWDLCSTDHEPWGATLDGHPAEETPLDISLCYECVQHALAQ